MSTNITFQLDLSHALKYDENNKLSVNVSPRSGNTLTIENDGLYAQANPGQPGSSGTGYPDGYRSDNGLISGIDSPYSYAPVARRIVASSIIHRIYTCSNTDGSDIQIRSVDRMYCGDMYRVKDTTHNNWNYYIILSVNSAGTAVASHSGVVATIPISANNVN